MPQDPTGYFSTATATQPAGAVEGAAPSQPAPWPKIGERVDDFDLAHLLGEGAFGQVFLARQISLDREVALKITRKRGHEAQTLAHLEHDHIVRVFSESMDGRGGFRLLCMQYVPGTTLARIIASLDWTKTDAGDGAGLLAAVDALSSGTAVFDPTAFREREVLADCDFVEAACWIVAKLATALAYAHNRGILHRDIKPANILINRYGRPMLVDFNVSADQRLDTADGGSVGGTPNYMAPEHIDALNPCLETPAEAVDARSDIFALGVVLFELLTGKLPFDPNLRGEDAIETMDLRAAQRRAGPPSARKIRPAIPAVVDRVIGKCLAPDPNCRFQSAQELVEALDGCRHLRRAERNMPRAGPLCRAALRRPILTGILLAFLPHVVGSGVNIAYNASQIVTRLTPAQQQAFAGVALTYNVVVYPICVAIFVWGVVPLLRMMREGRDGEAARRLALKGPAVAASLAVIGWLPGGFAFPLAIHLWRGPIDWATAGHFVISFSISGLIALTYSVLGVQFVVVRSLYPRLWDDGTGAARAANIELRSIDARLSRLQILAGLIPLAGAALIIDIGPENQLTLGYRLLVTTLIALGMAGFAATMTICGQIAAALASLRGTKA